MILPMRIVRIVEGTSVDGPGLRTSIYFAGCSHRCPGCHNQQTWDFQGGQDMTVDEVLQTILYNENNVTFSGGDPIYQAEAIIPLARAIKGAGMNIWCYTGFTFEQLREGIDEVPKKILDEFLSLVDVLVDGPFILDRRDISLLFRGSANQRLIDIPRTLASGKIIEFTPEPVW